MKKMSIALLGSVVGFGLLGGQPAHAAQPDAVAFYKSLRDMKMIISSSPGGSYDTYARLLARHMDTKTPWVGESTFWDETRVELPGTLAHPEFYNPLTGEVLSSTRMDEQPCIQVHRLFVRLPVALLCSAKI